MSHLIHAASFVAVLILAAAVISALTTSPYTS